MSPEEIQARYGYTPEQAQSLAEQTGWAPPPATAAPMPQQASPQSIPGFAPAPAAAGPMNGGPPPGTITYDDDPILRFADNGDAQVFRPGAPPPKVPAPASPREAQIQQQGPAASSGAAQQARQQQFGPPETGSGERVKGDAGVDFWDDQKQPAKTPAGGGNGAPAGMSRAQALLTAQDAMGLTSVSPETKARRDNAEYRYRSDLAEQARLHQNAYAETAGALQGVADATRGVQDRLTAQGLAQRQAEDEYRKHIQASEEALAKHKEDPYAGFIVRGTAGGILRGIAMAVGAFAQGFSGGKVPNVAADIINQNVSTEVAKQREEYSRGAKRIAGLRTLYGELRQRGLDDQTAALTAHKMYLDSVQARLGAMQAKLGSDDARMNAAKAIDQLDAQKAALDEQREQGIGQFAFRLQHPPATGPKPFTEGQVGEYSQRLEKAGIPEGEQTIADLKKHAFPQGVKIDDNQPIEGIGPWEDMKDNVPLVGQYLHSREGRINRGNIDRLFMAYRHEVTGSGGAEKEMEAIHKAAMGAGTAAEINHFIQQADAILAAKKRNIQAGTKPEAIGEYERRRSAVTPPDVKLNKVR